MDNKKQCVSVRLKPKDVDKIERIAKRLGVRNSDIIRYAIKTTLTQLISLQNQECRGYRLLPMFIEHATALTNHLDLDADKLEEILNDGLPEDEKIHRSDIELVAMSGLPQQFIQQRIEEIFGHVADMDELPLILEEYLMEKYANSRSQERTDNSLMN